MYDANQFRHELLERHANLERFGARLEEFLGLLLDEKRAFVHGVVVRAKSIESAVGKLRRKRYGKPWKQMNDLVGGRIFTYFREDSASVEGILRGNFDILEEESSDKAESLGVDKFGYTSRHLVCRVRDSIPDLKLRSSDFRNIWFELQIRTVLEHAWAEIEHELVYKAGTKQPVAIRRRFAAAAAALEIVENEFARLREHEPTLVSERAEVVSAAGEDLLDRAWLLACLVNRFPGLPTWSTNPIDNVFYPRLELAILDQLTAIGCDKVARWREVLHSSKLDTALSIYCRMRGIHRAELSHRPIALVACLILSGEEDLEAEIERAVDGDIRGAMAEVNGESADPAPHKVLPP